MVGCNHGRHDSDVFMVRCECVLLSIVYCLLSAEQGIAGSWLVRSDEVMVCYP